MQNSKAIDILKCFSKKELKKFEDFVCSPYFNKNEDIKSLLIYIRQFAFQFTDQRLDKVLVYKHIYPNKEFDYKKMRYLVSNLSGLLESFISISKLQSQPILELYYILTTYSEWNLDKHFNYSLQHAEKIQKKNPKRNTDYYYNQHLISKVANIQFAKQKKHIYDHNIQKAVDELDLFYLSSKLHFSCEILNRQKQIKSRYELHFLDEILTYLKNGPYGQYPAVAIYNTIIMTILESNNPEYFYMLKELLSKSTDFFTVEELRDCYSYLQNYCARRINQGDNSYYKEVFEIYKFLLENEILLIDNIITHGTYKNIVGVGLKLKEFDWVESFINKYKSNITNEFRETSFAFNLANLYYYQKEYSKALKCLSRVDFTDVIYSLDTKVMMLKIYYEQDESTSILLLIDSFRKYISRNKLIAENLCIAYKNFLNYANKLSKLIKSDKEKLYELYEEIKEIQPIPEKQWLLEQLALKLPNRSQ